jgi:hypothetical protein
MGLAGHERQVDMTFFKSQTLIIKEIILMITRYIHQNIGNTFENVIFLLQAYIS